MSGGGLNGAHHGGVLEALFAAGITPAAYCGVSAGALCAAYVAQYNTAASVAALRDYWLGLTRLRDVRAGGTVRAVWRALTGRSSLYTLDPLRQKLAAAITQPPVVPCVLGCVSLLSGQYLGLEVSTADGLRQAALASSTMPLMGEPVGDQALVDGGVAHVSPIGDAFRLVRRYGWDDAVILHANCWTWPLG